MRTIRTNYITPWRSIGWLFDYMILETWHTLCKRSKNVFFVLLFHFILPVYILGSNIDKIDWAKVIESEEVKKTLDSDLSVQLDGHGDRWARFYHNKTKKYLLIYLDNNSSDRKGNFNKKLFYQGKFLMTQI